MQKTPDTATSGVFRKYLTNILPENSAPSQVFSKEISPYGDGSRYTWNNAPPWWNLVGEKIYQTEGDKVWLCYWRSPIALHSLKVIERRESI